MVLRINEHENIEWPLAREFASQSTSK